MWCVVFAVLFRVTCPLEGYVHGYVCVLYSAESAVHTWPEGKRKYNDEMCGHREILQSLRFLGARMYVYYGVHSA